MGSGKIDINKIAPSPQLSAITGFIKGLRNRQAEMQAQEEKEAKFAIDKFRAEQQAAYQDRMASAREAEVGISSGRLRHDIAVDWAKIDQANMSIQNQLQQTQIQLNNFLLEQQKYDEEPERKATYSKMQYILDAMMEDLKAINQEKADERKARLEYGDNYDNSLGTKYQDFKFSSALEEMRQTGQFELQEARQRFETGENARDRATRLQIAEMRGSEAGKTPEVKTYLTAAESYLDEIAQVKLEWRDKETGEVNVPDDEMARLDAKYKNTLALWARIPEEERNTLPIPSQFIKEVVTTKKNRRFLPDKTVDTTKYGMAEPTIESDKSSVIPQPTDTRVLITARKIISSADITSADNKSEVIKGLKSKGYQDDVINAVIKEVYGQQSTEKKQPVEKKQDQKTSSNKQPKSIFNMAKDSVTGY